MSNSLDTRREAGAAYIPSQAHEGWQSYPELYDDAGYSGGSMEHPGLLALLDAVRSGRIDYVALGSVYAPQSELPADGMRTKKRIDREGRPYRRANFSPGALYQMLGNRIYRGEIKHRGKTYTGEHEPTIEERLFNAVQDLLAGNRRDNSKAVYAHHPSLLADLLWDSGERRITSAHANKTGVRYRYCAARKRSGCTCPAVRVPAGELEVLVFQQVAHYTQGDAVGGCRASPEPRS